MSVVSVSTDLYGSAAVDQMIWYRTEPRSLAGIRLLARWLAPLTALFKRS